MELISLRDVPEQAKIAILRELGYDSDGKYVTKDGARLLDPYTKTAIRLSRMLILPGSAVILDDNELSIASYFEEYGDDRFEASAS